MILQPECVKVLLVDDEPAIIMSLDFLIRKAGYQLFVARNGQEALDLAREHLPHLLVLDIMMPDIDGLEVCRQLKADPLTASARVLFLSAKSHNDDVRRGMDLGADAYITKPFSNKVLMEKIRELASVVSPPM